MAPRDHGLEETLAICPQQMVSGPKGPEDKRPHAVLFTLNHNISSVPLLWWMLAGEWVWGLRDHKIITMCVQEKEFQCLL